MVIRSSSAQEVERLVAQLRDGTSVQREAAIARLRVIGARAVARLSALASSRAPDVARAAALKAIEGIDDPSARNVALGLTRDAAPAVAAAAVHAARSWVASEETVLDAITALVLDRTRHPSVRLAALDALLELPRTTVEPVLQQLGDDPVLKARRQQAAVTHGDPPRIREWLALRGAGAPLSDIHDVIVRIREHEAGATGGRLEWQAARAAAHQVLAQRGSRVALYDLRETFDRAEGPLPLEFVTAAGTIGDASCLEPLARAWAASTGERWWQDRLADAGRAIVAREKLTGRHAVVKRLRARHPGFV